MTEFLEIKSQFAATSTKKTNITVRIGFDQNKLVTNNFLITYFEYTHRRIFYKLALISCPDAQKINSSFSVFPIFGKFT